jgi:polar amino acid transport system substrate-binding protein
MLAEKREAVATGASSGIGFDLATCAADDGSDHGFTADEAAIETVAFGLRKTGASVRSLQPYPTTEEDIAMQHRPVEYVVVCAGRGLGRAFLNRGWNRFREIIRLNETGTMLCCPQMLRAMQVRGNAISGPAQRAVFMLIRHAALRGAALLVSLRHAAKAVISFCWRIIALLALCSFLVACDETSFPRDPEKTLETVLAEGQMTVAVADNPPWVTVDDHVAPQGAEIELVRDFADELGVAIEWRRHDSFAALEGLERGDVDLAIGGFDREAVVPVAGAAPSYTYFKEEIVIGVRSDVANPDELEGRQVFVPRDLLMAELVRSKGGVPVEEWTEEVDLAAVPQWQLVSRDLRPTGIILHRAQHVVAVRQGENAWLMRLEGFLRRKTDDMGAHLRANAR